MCYSKPVNTTDGDMFQQFKASLSQKKMWYQDGKWIIRVGEDTKCWLLLYLGAPQLVKVMRWVSASTDKTVLNLKFEFSILYFCLQMEEHLTWNKKWGLPWQAVVYLLCYLKILCSDKFETYSTLSELLFSGTLRVTSVKLNGGEWPKEVIIILWAF